MASKTSYVSSRVWRLMESNVWARSQGQPLGARRRAMMAIDSARGFWGIAVVYRSEEERRTQTKRGNTDRRDATRCMLVGFGRCGDAK